MKKLNIGGKDQVLRILAGAALIALTLAGIIGTWGWIGAVLLATGLFKFCPAYRAFGIDTSAANGNHLKQ